MACRFPNWAELTSPSDVEEVLEIDEVLLGVSPQTTRPDVASGPP
jgi:hypothetical protein